MGRIPVINRQLDEMQNDLRGMRWSLAKMADSSVGVELESWADMKNAARLGILGEFVETGDMVNVNKATSVTAVCQGSISASVNLQTFIEAEDEACNKEYDFEFDGNLWIHNGSFVTLSDYGITVTGTPQSGNKIHVIETATAIPFRFMCPDGYDTPVAENLTHAATLMTENVLTNIVFDPKQAFYVASEVLPAGTYYFEVLEHSWVTADVGKNYQFTLTQDLPVGGQLVFGNSYNATFNGANVQVYASGMTTTVTENCVMTEGSSGTKLGVYKNSFDTENQPNWNHGQRALLGSANYLTGIIKKWANSKLPGAASGAIASWYEQTNRFDRPYVSTLAGFLYGLDPAFVKAVIKVKKRTALNTVDRPFYNNASYVDTEELFYVPSRTELFGSNEYTGVNESGVDHEGNTKATAFPYLVGADNTLRIKTLNGSVSDWWVRSASYAYHARLVDPDGSLVSTFATYSVGAVLACSIG